MNGTSVAAVLDRCSSLCAWRQTKRLSQRTTRLMMPPYWGCLASMCAVDHTAVLIRGLHVSPRPCNVCCSVPQRPAMRAGFRLHDLQMPLADPRGRPPWKTDRDALQHEPGGALGGRDATIQTPSLTSPPCDARLHIGLPVNQYADGRSPVPTAALRTHLRVLGTARRQQVGLLRRKNCYAAALRSAGQGSTDPRPQMSICIRQIRPSNPT